MLHLSKLLDKKYPLVRGIYHSLAASSPSQRHYDLLHLQNFHQISDGSYEILAQFAQGNITLDLACGDGFLTRLAPQTTVGVEFSLTALKKAKRNGAKYLVLADAHDLPFKDNSFDLCICTGSLEHFRHPHQVLKEVKRVSRTQIIISHRPYPIPFANILRKLILKLTRIPDQPIDNPLSLSLLHKLYQKTNLKIIYEGVWTMPYNLEMVFPYLPKFLFFPSCTFIISRSE